jgi:hypothetical protein
MKYPKKELGENFVNYCNQKEGKVEPKLPNLTLTQVLRYTIPEVT